MDRNDNEKLKAMLEEKKAKSKAKSLARDILLDMLCEVAPSDDKPLFELPKLCRKAIKKLEGAMMVVISCDNHESSVQYAARACEFIASINESIETFVEQNTPAGAKKPDEFDQM